MAAKQMIAIFGAMAFMGTFLLVVATGAALIVVKALGDERLSRWAGATSGWLFGGRGLTRKISLVGAILLAGYGATLVGASTASHQWELAPGQEKYFCEIDCHLAYSVTSVETRKTVGAGASQRTAIGDFYVVNVRTRFDEKTISPNRGDSPLTPSPRQVTLVDNQGREYSTSVEGQAALQISLGDKWIPMTEPLRPGESYSTALVFDLPPGVQGLNLLVASPTNPGWIGRLLIGDEGSILHKKVYLRITS
jgi:Domain of unknown function (DUF4352)